MEITNKIRKYEEFLNNVLKKDLEKELEIRDKLCNSIAAYSQLNQTIHCIIDTDLKDGLRTQVDLGCNCYGHAHIPDPSKIFVKIGLDVHLEMTLREASDYCEKKVKILNEEVENSSLRSAQIKGKIRFVELALFEIQGLNVGKQGSTDPQRSMGVVSSGVTLPERRGPPHYAKMDRVNGSLLTKGFPQDGIWQLLEIQLRYKVPSTPSNLFMKLTDFLVRVEKVTIVRFDSGCKLAYDSTHKSEIFCRHV